jgi:hypothetical protein
MAIDYYSDVRKLLILVLKREFAGIKMKRNKCIQCMQEFNKFCRSFHKNSFYLQNSQQGGYNFGN